MRVDVLTLFPSIVEGALSESIIGRARKKGLLELHIHDLRPYGLGKHRSTDDTPYGGGPGMVMRCDPLFNATESILGSEFHNTPRILMCPQGRLLRQSIVREISKLPRLFIICGHYEGVDERVRQYLATDTLSIGDYVLTNGALSAAVLIDAVTRLLPGVLGCSESPIRESFSHSYLEGPTYTRPPEFRGWKVPEILLSGNHKEIAAWRENMARIRTQQTRPDIESPEN
jgi:tRNA (guanine37-N1)-methyltransferase